MTDIVIQKGTDSGRRWLVNSKATGIPYDLTGWTVRSQIRTSFGSSVVEHEFSTTLGNAQLTADGEVILSWSAAETSAWKFRMAVYDIELTSPEGKTLRLDGGSVSALPEVTR